jgi:hypothetical protein
MLAPTVLRAVIVTFGLAVAVALAPH